MSTPDSSETLQFHKRSFTTVSLDIPDDTLAQLTAIATSRDMSPTALLKLYIGKCLRHDLSEHNGQERVDPLDLHTTQVT